MFEIQAPKLIHEIRYRSSGSQGPRQLTLPIFTVCYRAEGLVNPAFIAMADLQGRECGAANRLLGEYVADEVAVLQEIGELPAFELCLLCGDFYDYPDLRKLGGTGDVTTAINALSRLASQTVVVLGNHDQITPEQLVSEIKILDGATVETDAFTIGGVSGIVGNPKRNNRKTEADFMQAIAHCSNSRVDLLLLHQGPQGATTKDRGLDLINQQLRKRSELLVLFGHCHWDQPFYREYRNLFCNVDARVVAFIPQSDNFVAI